MTVTAPPQNAGPAGGIVSAAALPATDVLKHLDVTADSGLSGGEVARRQARWGPNTVSSHRARLWPVMWHQLRSPLLGLLLTAAVASYFVGERSNAVIIGVIVALSVGLGFVNEYRAEKAAEALHDQIHHETVVLRDATLSSVDVTALVPGRHAAGPHPRLQPAARRILRGARRHGRGLPGSRRGRQAHLLPHCSHDPARTTALQR